MPNRRPKSGVTVFYLNCSMDQTKAGTTVVNPDVTRDQKLQGIHQELVDTLLLFRFSAARCEGYFK